MKRSLTDITCRNAKPHENGKPKKYADGGGLYLYVSKNTKVWRYRYRIGGKDKTLIIGNYPATGLREARTEHEQFYDMVTRDIDPKLQQEIARTAQVNTFEAVAREWHETFRPQWSASHAEKLIRRLERDVFPWIGSTPIADIEPPGILAVINRVAERSLDIAHRTRGNIGEVFRYAVRTGRAKRDQTADLKGALPPTKTKHFAAITDPKDVGELLRAIEGYSGTPETCTALRLAPYLFVRPGELRRMEWAEIDKDKARWEIPADKMKMDNPHIVPLPRQALALLEGIQPITGHYRYVFPSRTDNNEPMSNNTLRQALRRLDYGGIMTAHGFRAMARTILDEELEYDERWIEQQLAHTVKDHNGRAYNRTKHLRQRTAMMQAWADYLDKLRDGAQVIPFKVNAG